MLISVLICLLYEDLLQISLKMISDRSLLFLNRVNKSQINLLNYKFIFFFRVGAQVPRIAPHPAQIIHQLEC